MQTLRLALEKSNNRVIVGHIAKKKAEEDARRKHETMMIARKLRDKAIAKVHELSYSRKNPNGGGKLVPRRKELRDELKQAMQEARIYAKLARPEHGYPAPPFRRDPEYPVGAQLSRPNQMDFNAVSAERNRLVFWMSVLESRNASNETKANVAAHIERLELKLRRMSLNDHVARKPGSKEFTLRPAPSNRNKLSRTIHKFSKQIRVEYVS